MAEKHPNNVCYVPKNKLPSPCSVCADLIMMYVNCEGRENQLRFQLKNNMEFPMAIKKEAIGSIIKAMEQHKEGSPL